MSQPHALPIACACGQFQAALNNPSPKTNIHAECYCIDCQAFARHLGQADRVLSPEGGTDLYQVHPSQFEILVGHEHLALLRLSPKGLNRWFASCCNTPLCNTAGSPKIAFAGVMIANIAPPLDALGPVQFRYKTNQALSPVSAPSGNLALFVLHSIRNVLRARLNGSWRETPFFDVETGRATAKPYTLTKTERDAAYST